MTRRELIAFRESLAEEGGMARTFVYQYLGQEEPVVKPDPDEQIAIPEKGEIIVRNGKIWRIVSVKFTETFGPERNSPSRLEVRVSLASLRPPQASCW